MTTYYGYDNWKLSCAEDYAKPTDVVEVMGHFKMTDVDGEVYEATFYHDMTFAEAEDMTQEGFLDAFAEYVNAEWNLEDGHKLEAEFFY